MGEGFGIDKNNAELIARQIVDDGAGNNISEQYPQISTWIAACRRPSDAFLARPMLVAINGPQGSGKTSLCRNLLKNLAERGLAAAALSVDDFYLSRQDQIALARANPNIKIWQQRGYPGTHDISLGCATINGLLSGQPTSIPRYDKGACSGKGDRLPPSDWDRPKQKLDIVLLEGWMIGFLQSQDCPAALEPANALLSGYLPWWTNADAFICMWTNDLSNVADWRVEAEQKMRSETGRGMTDEDCRAYIEEFMPAYQTWGFGPDQGWPTIRPLLKLGLDSKRNLVGA